MSDDPTIRLKPQEDEYILMGMQDGEQSMKN